MVQIFVSLWLLTEPLRNNNAMHFEAGPISQSQSLGVKAVDFPGAFCIFINASKLSCAEYLRVDLLECSHAVYLIYFELSSEVLSTLIVNRGLNLWVITLESQFCRMSLLHRGVLLGSSVHKCISFS